MSDEWSAVMVRFTIALLLWFCPQQLLATQMVAVKLNGNQFTDRSENNHAQFNVRWVNLSPVTLEVRLKASDTDHMLLAFSAELRNSTRFNWSGLKLSITGKPTWEGIWQIYSRSGRVERISKTSKIISVAFKPPVIAPRFIEEEWRGIVVLGSPATNDIKPMEVWDIDLNGLGTDDAFRVQLSPLPVK